MSENNYKFSNVAPPISEFIDFRALCGWGTLSLEAAQRTLAAGIANTTVYNQGNVVGFGRIIGDGAIYFYIQDLIVGEPYRKTGTGSDIMIHLIAQIREIALPGASIGLMSAVTKENFYKKFGFISRPSHNYGAGMTLLLDKT